MIRKHFSFITIILGLIFIVNTALAASPSFEGKTVSIIVGLSAGGGYDLWARMIGRHIGKHIPGKPAVIVNNMPGAGSLVAANYIYTASKPDGLTIGHISGIVLMNQLFDKPGIKFDARKYKYIGAPYQDDMVVFLSKARGVTNMDEWFNAKEPVKLGGQAPGATFSDNVPRILRTAIGLPVKPVSGYHGTAEVKLAVASGEVDGNCLSWESGKATWRSEIQKGDIIPILQLVKKPIPEIPDVPMAITYAKNDEARILLDAAVHNPPAFARPFLLHPETPDDIVKMLRNAFEQTMDDPEFKEELVKAKLNPKPLSGQDLEKVILDLFKLDPGLIAKLKDVLLK